MSCGEKMHMDFMGVGCCHVSGSEMWLGHGGCVHGCEGCTCEVGYVRRLGFQVGVFI